MKNMNSKCFNVFTYSKDFPCLVECLKSIRRLTGCKTSQIFVWDDGNSPISDDQRKMITADKNLHYEQTFFNRNKNLNGLDCVTGMLVCLELSRRFSGARSIFKVDSDSYINRLEYWLDGLKAGYDMVGFAVSPKQSYCAGCCYALNGELLYDMIANHMKLIHEPSEVVKTAPHFPEDLSITELVRLCNGKVLISDSNEKVSSKYWVLAPFRFSEYKNDHIIYNCLNRYRFYSIVNFGNRFEIGENMGDPHEIAGSCMKIYGDFIKQSTFFH